MNSQTKAMMNDIVRRIDDLECSILGIYRDLRLLEKNDDDLSTTEALRVRNTRKLCLRLLHELCEF